MTPEEAARDLAGLPARSGAAERLAPARDLGATGAGADLVTAVLDTVPNLVVVLDRAGKIVRFNVAGQRATGYSAAEVLGRSVFDVFVPEEERASARATFERLRAGDFPNQHRRRWRLKDGSVRVYEWANSCTVDERGEVKNVVGTATDVTERPRSEQWMRAGEPEAHARAALMEAVLDCIADGVIIYDRDGRTIRSSPAADEILNLAPAERQAPLADRVTKQYEIYAEDGRRLGPDDMIAIRAALRGETIRGAIQQVRAGDHAPRWLMMNAMPLLVGGEHTGAVLSLTDITARKRAEEELALMTRLYAVLSRVNEAIVRTRDEPSLYEEVCRIVAGEGGFPLVWVGLVAGREVRPAAAAGSAVDYLRDIRVEVDGELGQGPTGTCVREGGPVINYDFESNPSGRPWRKATEKHGLRSSVALPLQCGGRIVGAVTFYTGQAGSFTAKQVQLLEALCADVSYALDAIAQERLRAQAERALRQSEQSLREADRRKDEFLSMLSHELRNPLAPIRNSVYVLRHADPGGAQAARARTVIERQAEHLTRLVDDLLDVTRIARGKAQLRKSRLDLRDVVLQAADDFRVVMDERGITLQLSVPPVRAWVDADPTRLAQVVGNLLHNAAKFSRRGDQVTLALEVRQGHAELRVRDTGAGIDAALLPSVFEAFVQGERTLARSEGGLGLGLALVKGIVDLHGGAVHAESAGKDQGAEFTVRLPLLETVAAPDAHPGALQRGPGRRILVVDDNEDAAESLADLLKVVGHAVDVRADGPSAIEKACADPPDVVLCDIGLPGMSGYDVARELRRHAALRATRLIALTGYAQAEDKQRARDAGFDAHLAKPPDVDELMNVVAGRS